MAKNKTKNSQNIDSRLKDNNDKINEQVQSINISERKDILEKNIYGEKKDIINIYSKVTLSDKDIKMIKAHETKIRDYEAQLLVINGGIEKNSKGLRDKIVKITSDTEISGLMDELKAGLKDILTTGKYQEYLNFQSSLYNYSFNNCILIMLQRTNISYVGSYTFWKQNNRYVNKGENGIKIFAPVTKKEVKEIPLLDEKNKPRYDGNGKQIMEKVTRTVLNGFKLTTVFDVSQTSGEPLPNLVKELKGNSSTSEKLFNAIKSISNIPIKLETIAGKAKGYYDPELKEIVIKNGMNSDQSLKTLIHEYTHSKLHNDLHEYKLNRGEFEIQAESVAYMVSKHFGLDTSDYSFGYVAIWAGGKELDEMQHTLKVISETSKKIIGEIENYLAREYDLKKNNPKEFIKQMLKENGFQGKDKVISNIEKLNKITGKTLSLKEIKDMYKDIKQHKGSKEEKEIIQSIGNELKSQEISKSKKVSKSLELEPSV